MRLLVSRSGGLGDAVLTLPVARCLMERFTDPELHVLGNGAMLDVARMSGLFTEERSLDESGFAALYTGAPPGVFLGGYFSRYDIVFMFSASPAVKLKEKILAAGARECHVLDPRPPDGWARHITDHLLSIIGDPGKGYDLKPRGWGKVSDNGVPGCRKGLVIHPGSGSLKKNWPLERFVGLARRVDMPVTFILGPAEHEKGMGRSIPGDFRTVSPQNLDELVCLLAGAEMYCGNDSGVSHCAALSGAPSVVLFGSSDPVVWRPLRGSAPVEIIASPDKCMDGLTVSHVADIVLNMIADVRNPET